MAKLTNYITLVDCLNVPKGSKVSADHSKDITGKTGKILCNVPQGGGLFYNVADLKEVV